MIRIRSVIVSVVVLSALALATNATLPSIALAGEPAARSNTAATTVSNSVLEAAAESESSRSTDLVPTAVRASNEAVRDLLAAQRIDTRPPRPGFGSYLRDLGLAMSRGLGAWLQRLAPGFEVAGRWLAGLDPRWLWLTAVVLASIVALRLFERSRRDQPPGRPASTPSADTPTRAIPPTDRVAAVEAGLAAGDVTGALEALWWWLAERLGCVTADPSWTSRELVLRARRRDLLPIVRRFDGLLYGRARPDTERVRGFWRDLRGALG